jgi:transcription elongation GreA/GreB family factor
MSRAFVKEFDEPSVETLAELPVSSAPNLVTPRGFAAIDAKVAKLEAALHAATDEQELAALRRDLRYWHSRRATAQITESRGDVVGFGTKVRFRRGRETPRTIEIVGEDEADPTVGRIAYVAPIAHAMMGAEPGDTVDLGDARLTVIKVEPIDD